MKWNVFPQHKIPIDYVTHDEFGEQYVRRIGWIITPNIEVLKDDHREHLELVKR